MGTGRLHLFVWPTLAQMSGNKYRIGIAIAIGQNALFLAATHNANMDICFCCCWTNCYCCCCCCNCCCCQLYEFRNRNKVALNALGAPAIANCIYILHLNLHFALAFVFLVYYFVVLRMLRFKLIFKLFLVCFAIPCINETGNGRRVRHQKPETAN